MRKTTYITMMVLICMLALPVGRDVHAAPYQAGPGNLLANPGFKQGEYSPTGAPSGWSRDIFDPSAVLLWDDAQPMKAAAA